MPVATSVRRGPKAAARGLAGCCFKLLLLATFVLPGPMIRAGDANAAKSAPKAKTERPRGTPAGPDFVFTVVTTAGKPVAGAKVTVWQVAWRDRIGRGSGSFTPDQNLIPPTETEADGTATLILPPLHVRDAKTEALREADVRGIYSIGLIVDHPDHPIWQDYARIEGNRRIVLAQSTIIEIRARRPSDHVALSRLAPVFASALYRGADWSEKDGILTVRRLDVQRDTRSMRIVHVPQAGPLLFSDELDLTQKTGGVISLDVALKPGVRVEGRLAAEVPRPVKNGHVVGCIVLGPPFPSSFDWETTAPIAADGTFVIDACPPGENLQVVAVCDGWASRSPSREEVRAYSAENSYPVAYSGPRASLLSPRIYRLKGTTIHPVVPMDPTATCEVTVHGETGRPVSGAEVAFWPNQHWHNRGSNIVGHGWDFPSLIRQQLASGRHQSNLGWRPAKEFSAVTDARGVATVRNLPIGSVSGDDSGGEQQFSVSRDGYHSTADPLGGSKTRAKLVPGKTSRTTVKMERN